MILFLNFNFYFIIVKYKGFILQFKKLHLGIIMGGGKASILSEGKVDKDLLLQESSCFIEPIRSQIVKEESKNFLREIVSALQQ